MGLDVADGDGDWLGESMEPDGDGLDGDGLSGAVVEDGPAGGTLSPPQAIRTKSSTRNSFVRRMNAMLPAAA
ncbi:MAG TPA: hypothetical protein VGR41_10860 [Actinomycetota bacterium]|jgi:hypothetical protein|nr:hypothetical protein [Actinomycetota bacterium]